MADAPVLSEWARNVIVSTSFFAIGVTLFMAVRNLLTARRVKGHERRLNLAYACARIGFVITIGLITEAVFQTPAVPLEWRTFLYIIGVLLAGAGYLGVAFETRRGRS